MLVFPLDKPVTRPVGLTLATAGFELLQVPPGSPVVVNVDNTPVQNPDEPLTVPAETFGFTVSNASVVNTSGHPSDAFSLYLFVLNKRLGFVIVSEPVVVPL